MNPQNKNKPAPVVIIGIVAIIIVIISYFILLMFFPEIFQSLPFGEQIPVQN